MKQAGAFLGLIYGSRKRSPRLSAHGTVNAITWWGEEKKKKTSDIEMNYTLVTVPLQIGSDCSL